MQALKKKMKSLKRTSNSQCRFITFKENLMRHFSFQILILKLINILIKYEYEQIVNNNDHHLKRAKVKHREVKKREVKLQLLRRALI